MLSILQSSKQFDEIRSDRLDICIKCDEAIRPKSKSIQCSKCKCFMLGKTRMPAAKCPLGKWKL